jgi:hypothetical protein
MRESDIYMFLGWLQAKGVIKLDYDRRRQFYIERRTGRTVSEIADEYIRDTTPANDPIVTLTGEIKD